MRFASFLHEAEFVKRPNRFAAVVRLPGVETISAPT